MTFVMPYDEGQFKHNDKVYMKSSFNPDWFKLLLGRDPETVFEFGSADGGDGLRYKLAFPNCDVYSFEPDPVLYDNVQNIRLFGVKTYNIGFSNKTEVIPFYPGKMRENNSRIGVGSCLKIKDSLKEDYTHLDFEIEPITIKCTTIKEFCSVNNVTSIDFMQIDVEGVADRVIAGFGDIRPKILFIELAATENSYVGAAKVDVVNDMLVNMGYGLICNNGTDSLYTLGGVNAE